jgi:hypothetical protein
VVRFLFRYPRVKFINGEDVKFAKAQRIKMAGTCKDSGSGSNAEKDVGRKNVNRKKKRKTPSEMDGICCIGLESNEDKAVNGEGRR